jgi:NAD(P)-dependent dehydrogenase (short-subunit alcohol dehydrogenase family)
LLKNENQREASILRHPMKRLGTPADISNAVSYLLSEQSSWTTGQVLHVDGGLSTLY